MPSYINYVLVSSAAITLLDIYKTLLIILSNQSTELTLQLPHASELLSTRELAPGWIWYVDIWRSHSRGCILVHGLILRPSSGHQSNKLWYHSLSTYPSIVASITRSIQLTIPYWQAGARVYFTQLW